MQLLLPCKCRDKGEEDFWNLFPAHLLLLFSPPLAHKTWTQATSHTLPPLMQAMTGHPTLYQDMGKITTLPCAMAEVSCPSLPAAINTEMREDKRGEGEHKRGGRVYLRGEELGQNRRKRKRRGKGEWKSKTEEGGEEPPLHLHQRLHHSSQPPPTTPSSSKNRGKAVTESEVRREKGERNRKQRLRSLHREEEEPSSPSGHYRCASSPPPQHHCHPAIINVANVSRTREGEEKGVEQRGKKKIETAGSVQRRRRKDSRATAWNHRHFSSQPLLRPPSTTARP